jgi:hypothetical protein
MKQQEKKVTISGEISSIKFRNNENWACFTVQAGDHCTGLDYVNCIGTLADMCKEGSEVTCTGTIENSKFGRQIKCSSIVPKATI